MDWKPRRLFKHDQNYLREQWIVFRPIQKSSLELGNLQWRSLRIWFLFHINLIETCSLHRCFQNNYRYYLHLKEVLRSGRVWMKWICKTKKTDIKILNFGFTHHTGSHGLSRPVRPVFSRSVFGFAIFECCYNFRSSTFSENKHFIQYLSLFRANMAPLCTLVTNGNAYFRYVLPSINLTYSPAT